MSEHDVFFQDAADELAYWHGDTWTYKPGEASTDPNRSLAHAIATPERREPRDTPNGRELVYARSLMIVIDEAAANFSGLRLDQIQENATVEGEGLEYLLEGFQSQDPTTVILQLRRIATMSKTRENYHRRER